MKEHEILEFYEGSPYDPKTFEGSLLLRYCEVDVDYVVGPRKEVWRDAQLIPKYTFCLSITIKKRLFEHNPE